jgi:ribosomal protein S21
MIVIDCSGRKIETCLKQYRQKLDRVGQMEELKKRKTFEKPSQKRRRATARAKYRLKVHENSQV